VFFGSQSHSSLNQFRHSDDWRTFLLLACLSFVDFYRPKYVIFENVLGFGSTPLVPHPDSHHWQEGGIKGGVKKLLLHILVALGYQCRLKVLDVSLPLNLVSTNAKIT
jgi:site-specific DNA-cytosine methylase